MNAFRISNLAYLAGYAICAFLLTGCATPANPPLAGLKPGLVYSTPSLAVTLLSTNQLYNASQTCELRLRLENMSGESIRPYFNVLFLDAAGNTLKEDDINFPTVLPGKQFSGVKYVYLLPCARMNSIQLKPSKRPES